MSNRRGIFDLVARRALWLFRFVPAPMREFAMRRTTPGFVVGAMCLISRDDGRVLLVKPSYRDVWTLPGGLTSRGEEPVDIMHRELLEETGLRCDVVSGPLVIFDAQQRIVRVP